MNRSSRGNELEPTLTESYNLVFLKATIPIQERLVVEIPKTQNVDLELVFKLTPGEFRRNLKNRYS